MHKVLVVFDLLVAPPVEGFREGFQEGLVEALEAAAGAANAPRLLIAVKPVSAHLLQDGETFQILTAGDKETGAGEVYFPLSGEQLRRAELVLRQAFAPLVVRVGNINLCLETKTLVGMIYISGEGFPISLTTSQESVEFIKLG